MVLEVVVDHRVVDKTEEAVALVVDVLLLVPVVPSAGSDNTSGI